MSWLKKLFSSDTEASTKRFVMVVLVVVMIIAMFLLMYFKIEVANKDLVRAILENIFWLILIFGGFVTAEQFISKWKPSTGTSVVNQNVEEQTVVTNTKPVVKKKA
jgi:hypothetical protein